MLLSNGIVLTCFYIVTTSVPVVVPWRNTLLKVVRIIKVVTVAEREM